MSKVKLSKSTKVSIGVFAILIVMVIFATGKLLSFANDSVDDLYPESGLDAESTGEMTYFSSNYFTNHFSCPSAPYEITFSSDVKTVGDTLVAEVDGGYTVLLSESTNAVDSVLGAVVKTEVNVIDDPTVVWYEVISDTGYMNTLKMNYSGGRVELDSKQGSATYYALAYQVVLPSEDVLIIAMYVEDIEKLASGKEILKDMIYSIRPLTESNGTGEIEDTQGGDTAAGDVSTDTAIDFENDPNVEKVDDDFYIVGDIAYINGEACEIVDMGLKELEENGNTTPVEVELSYYEYEYECAAGEEDVYFVFEYQPHEQLTECYAVSPSGRKHWYDDELSYSGHYVVPISKTEAGTYTLKISCLPGIYDLWSADYTIDSYYATFFNTTPDGTPLKHGFDYSEDVTDGIVGE